MSCAPSTPKSNEGFTLLLRDNAWIGDNYHEVPKVVTKNGIENWKSTQPITAYFYADKAGKINLKVKLKVINGPVQLSIKIGQQEKFITVKSKELKAIDIGSFKLQKSGYQEVIINKKTLVDDVQIVYLEIDKKTENKFYSIPESNTYFGRRGPSVHLKYELPAAVKDQEVEWFYNEIEVPKGEDVIGSYFMANGFGEGYFGIQVNSENERRILFSVWSPFKTDNPEDIPDDQKIQLLAKGEGVTTGKFGDEGAGGQSYKVYNWKPETTYKFLLRGHPVAHNYTQYTAYFFAPEEHEWQIIASFKRPKTTTYLTNFHSFLENFIPATGDIMRQANYKNQWVRTAKGDWYAVDSAKFTADATARGLDRFDYGGGVNSTGFYLKNCGFFNNVVEMNTEFNHAVKPNQPKINLSKLDKIAAENNISNKNRT
ncbi:DUF3472 domain-containing protein [Flammeovirga pectinis]|uniref:DUF3472 domain-containing protein n=1 Tax=Flammeovirga pectinis TaxID=2494373 RepID=A0A3Q9FQG8_9BACT|nr:DUF3472 domain-containing protein [Flammeovirga pectinis]AZQ65586.1 DUF3472 domain-containing protein [Flammeovirga pectinis]